MHSSIVVVFYSILMYAVCFYSASYIDLMFLLPLYCS